MNIQTSDPLIDGILSEWRERIGVDYEGYRGHVYRMFNFCLALKDCSEEERKRYSAPVHFLVLRSPESQRQPAPSPGLPPRP